MRFSLRTPVLLLSSLAVSFASAENILRSSSLSACQENSGFTASLFDVVFSPDNFTATVKMAAISSIEGYVKFDITVRAYGFQVIRTTVDPCKINLLGLCPMMSGKMDDLPPFNLPITREAIQSIPGIAYTFPDLDANVRILFNMTSGEQQGQTIACVETDISNGKTVDLPGVKWATAAVAGLALLSSAVIWGLGFSNAAAHVAASALSLFGYFQSQAMLGLCSVPLPPIVKSWTQDFQWSMGIINVDFVQTMVTWYQRATGGTATHILRTLNQISVQVEKRSLPVVDPAMHVLRRSAALVPEPMARQARSLAKRAYEQTSYGTYVVAGIQRVAFRAGIETTNLFLTGLTFFYAFVLITILLVVLFKLFCELAVKLKWAKSEMFADFRVTWLTVLKGILFRCMLIGFPQMTILCMWEFTQNDSAGAIVLAVFFFFGMLAVLSWASYKVIRMARRSLALHRNPAYILYSDDAALNKWGFLYVQFRASAYYYIVPVLIYTIVKGMFIAFAQRAGTVQAIAFIIIEGAALIAASVLRPWMDKSTNSFNISICAINFINAIFLFIFTDVLGLPPLVVGVVGVVLWILNAAFALVLLLMLIITTAIILFHNNPDTRYQFMHDDRTSFMKSQTQIHTTSELDALAATARGDGKTYSGMMDLEDDNSSGPMRPSTGHSNREFSNRDSARESMRSSLRHPVDPVTGVYSTEGPLLRGQQSGSVRASSPFTGSSSNLATGQTKPQSPWQRGAGYD